MIDKVNEINKTDMKIRHKINLLLLSFLVFSSFLGTNTLSFDTPLFKLSLFRIVFLVYSLFFLVNFFISLKREGIKKLFVKNNIEISLSLIYLIWFLLSLASVFWAKDKVDAIKTCVYVGIGFFSILYIVVGVKTKYDLLILLRAAAIGLSFHHVLSWSEIITGEHIYPSITFSENRLGNMPISSLGNPNNLATIILISTVISLILCAIEKNIFLKILSTLMFMSSFGIIYFSTSRANILGLIVFLGVVFVIYAYNIFNKKYTYRSLLYVMLVLLILFIGLIIFYLYKKNIFLKLDKLFDNIWVPIYGSIVNRFKLYLNGIFLLLSTKGIGVGAGNVEHYLQTVITYPTDTINMHSWFVEILACFGIVFFILYMVYYIKFALLILKEIEYSNKKGKFLLSVSVAYLFAFIMSSFSASTLILYDWVFIIFGLISAVYAVVKRSNANKEKIINKID